MIRASPAVATGPVLRPARLEDMSACAAILNSWIDATEWMPRVHPATDVQRHYRETVFRERRIWVAGRSNAVEGFIATDEQVVTALYIAGPAQGAGLGRALLDRVKDGQQRLTLWTFEANLSARAFYARQGLKEVRRTEGENEENLPDVLLEWRREDSV